VDYQYRLGLLLSAGIAFITAGSGLLGTEPLVAALLLVAGVSALICREITTDEKLDAKLTEIEPPNS